MVNYQRNLILFYDNWCFGALYRTQVFENNLK